MTKGYVTAKSYITTKNYITKSYIKVIELFLKV